VKGEENYEKMRDAVMEVVGGHFRPEFINRIDEKVVFHPLGRKELRLILGLMLNSLRKRLKARELTMELSDSAMDFVADEGYNPAFGARPLKRAIQQHLENALSQKLLAGDFDKGDNIKVDFVDGELTFGK